MRVLSAFLLLFLALPTWASEERSAIEPLASEIIENLFRFDEGIYSGGQPVGAEAFTELRERGIRTVLSVDGAIPDVTAAHNAGLTYIHLPVTYSGIPQPRALRFAKAIRDATPPIYVHCHHGKHRGPSAAALALVMLGRWTPDAAVAAMQTAQTSPNYTGLYASVREASVVPPATLDTLPDTFPSVAPVEPLVAMMVRIQMHYDHLKLSRAAGWEQPPVHPDINPAHEAMLMKEALFELHRNRGEDEFDAAYWAMMKANELAAEALERTLFNKSVSSRAGEWSDVLNKRMDAVSKTCASCHAVYRNIPLE